MRIEELTSHNISQSVVREAINSNPNQIREIINTIYNLGRDFSRLINIIHFIPPEFRSDLAKYFIEKDKFREVAKNLFH